MGARQVRRRGVGPRPAHLGSVAHRHVRKVATLKPGEMIVKRRPDRLEADGGPRRSRDRVGPRNRSEERRVGHESVRECRSRVAPEIKKKYEKTEGMRPG